MAQNPTGDLQFTDFTISAVPSSLAYLVVRNALPLQGLPAESTAAATNDSVTPTNSFSTISSGSNPAATGNSVTPMDSFSTISSSSNSAVTPTGPAQNSTAAPVLSGLSPGAAAGIGVGTAIGILAVAAFLILFFLRRRRHVPSSPPADFNQSKPELPASEAVTAKPQSSYPPVPPKVTPSAHHISNPAMELQATESFHELEGDAVRYGELDSSQRGN
jgi:hypothetical protein